MPSRSKKTKPVFTKSPSDVATALMGLTFGDLMEIADSLHTMTMDGDYDLKNTQGFAELIYNWAEAQRE